MPDEGFTAFHERPELLLVSVLVCLTSVSALVCGIVGLVFKARKTRDHRPYARWAKILGSAVLLFGVLGSASGLVHTYAAVAAVGFSASDKQRILSNGIAEAVYNLAFALVLGGSGVLLGFLGRRESERGVKSSGGPASH